MKVTKAIRQLFFLSVVLLSGSLLSHASVAEAHSYRWSSYRFGHLIHHRYVDMPFIGGWYFHLGSYAPRFVCRSLWNDGWVYGWADSYRCNFGYRGYSRYRGDYFVLSGVRGLSWGLSDWQFGWRDRWARSLRFDSDLLTDSSEVAASDVAELGNICRAAFQGEMYPGFREGWNCNIAVGDLEVVIPAGEFEVLVSDSE
jgi:hypothetical protein